MTRRTFSLATVVLVVVAAALQLLVFHDGFYALSQDDSYRTLDALAWSNDPSSGSSTWLPAHRVLVGSALRVWPDLISTPRVVSGVIAVLCVLLVIWVAWHLFGDRTTSAFAGALAVVYPSRLVLGAVPLAEILFIATVLLSMALLARWLARVHAMPRLLVAAAAFGVTTTVRYEGWLFAAGFAVLVIARLVRSPGGGEAVRRTSTRFAVLAAVLALVGGFPLYWLVTHTGASGGALTEASRLYGVFNPTDPMTLLRHNPLWQLVTSNAQSLTLVGVVPLVVALRSERRLRDWAFVPAVALAALSVAAFVAHALPSHTFWRIPAAWGVLLVPFAARWVVTTPIPPRARRARFALLVLIALPSTLACVDMTRRSALVPPVVELGRTLESRLDACGEGCKLLLDNATVDFVHVVVASQHPGAVLFTEEDAALPAAVIAPLDDALSAIETDEVGEAGDIRFLVLRADSTVERMRRSAAAREIGRFGPWTLFEAIDELP
jgi:hypothetical protein